MDTLTEQYARARMEGRGMTYVTWELVRIERRIRRIMERAQERVGLLRKRQAELEAEYERMREAGWTK